MDEIVALVTVFPTACQDRRLAELLAWLVTGNCVALASCGSVAVPCAHMQLRFGAMMPGCSTESVPGLLSRMCQTQDAKQFEFNTHLADEAVL